MSHPESTDPAAELRGRTALVTGGSDGIGLAVAQRLAAAGAALVLIGRDPGRLQRAADSMPAAAGAVRTLSVDLADVDALTDTLAAVAQVAADTSILVNNVGAASFADLADTTIEQIDAMVHLNVKLPLLLTRELLPGLTRRPSSVVNITSYWGDKMVEGRHSSAYSATRGAQASMTKALANELGPQQVRVNGIAPGSVRTGNFEREFLARMSDEDRERYEDTVPRDYPMGHIGEPSDVAEAVYYLASDRSRWVTGTIMRVDGGLMIR